MFRLRWLEYKRKEFRHDDVYGSKPEVIEVIAKKLQQRQRRLTVNIWGDVILAVPEQWTEWEDVPIEKST